MKIEVRPVQQVKKEMHKTWTELGTKLFYIWGTRNLIERSILKRSKNTNMIYAWTPVRGVTHLSLIALISEFLNDEINFFKKAVKSLKKWNQLDQLL